MTEGPYEPTQWKQHLTEVMFLLEDTYNKGPEVWEAATPWSIAAELTPDQRSVLIMTSIGYIVKEMREAGRILDRPDDGDVEE
jgi:hypothetical protein